MNNKKIFERQLVSDFRQAYLLTEHLSCVEWVARHGTGYTRKAGDTWSMFRHPSKGLKPCLCAHTDTVHPVKPTKTIRKKGGIIVAAPEGGLGADDRNGMIIAATLMSRGCPVDVAIFDLEETGAIGSRSIPLSELDATSIWIGLDRRGDREWVDYARSTPEIMNIMQELIPLRKFETGTFSDCAALSDRTGVACINLSAGLHQEHSEKEYASVSGMLWTVEDLERIVAPLSGRKFQVSIPAR